MIPVTQTILTAPGGDCFRACLASILELPLTTVPNFQDKDWQLQYEKWLKPFGLALLTTGMPDAEMVEQWPGCLFPGYTIIAVDSPRFPSHLHAVVALNGVVVWDPHPASTVRDYPNLVWREVSYFVALDAGRVIGARK